MFKRFMSLVISGVKRIEVRVQYALLVVSRTHHITLSSSISGWGSLTPNRFPTPLAHVVFFISMSSQGPDVQSQLLLD